MNVTGLLYRSYRCFFYDLAPCEDMAKGHCPPEPVSLFVASRGTSGRGSH